MSALLFYLTYPFVYLISIMPFWLLYAYSDFLYIILYHVFGYRKKVVRENLKNSFPDKNEKERLKIEKAFYHYLTDLLLETFKTFTWNQKTVLKRVKMHNAEIIQELDKKGKSVVIVMGHLGNWEWAGPGFATQTGLQLNVIYKPLTNRYYESVFNNSRTKFGTQITPMKNVLREMVSKRKVNTSWAFIADQTPAGGDAKEWTTFLNQDTAIFTGPEKLAKKFDYPVVYINVKRTKRGYYDIYPELITEFPKEVEDLYITKSFHEKFEKDVLQTPETWLWSHRRWKVKRA